MAVSFPAPDVAIAIAIRSNTLLVETRAGRFGDYVVLSDEARLIEVDLSQAEADARLAKIRAALQ
jgi:hypothetical protein